MYLTNDDIFKIALTNKGYCMMKSTELGLLFCCIDPLLQSLD